ncbi:DUF4397 domain-containing protein [Daejeonella sp.]|uniref:DUF4397 domain-containing protein n=1 Tax=Daejeonella sp. TaxID=2805397 RepID=UPI0030C30719
MKTLKTFGSLPYTINIFLFCTVLLTSFTSCVKKNVQPPEQQSAVNVINATIGSQAITYSINGVKVLGVLNYTNESKYFITFPGSRNFEFAIDGQIGTIGSAIFELKQNTYHSIFISGEPGAINTLLTTDDLASPPAGKAKIRFIHLSSDAGQLILGTKSGANLFPEQSYNKASPFIPLDQGVYDLQLKSSTGTLLVQANVTVAAGKIYNVWAKGLKSGVSNSPLGIHFSAVN